MAQINAVFAGLLRVPTELEVVEEERAPARHVHVGDLPRRRVPERMEPREQETVALTHGQRIEARTRRGTARWIGRRHAASRGVVFESVERTDEVLFAHAARAHVR